MDRFPLYQRVNGKFASGSSVRCIKRTTVLSEDIDEWCGQVADQLGELFGYRQFGKSTVVNNAVEFYRDFYDIHEALTSYRDNILELLSLPPDKREIAFQLIQTI